MQRLIILSVVLTVLIGLGGPVTAKPGKPKPPAPPPRLDVSIDANLYMWNVPGDEILFDLAIENATSTAIDNVAILLRIDGVEQYENTVDLVGGERWTYPDPGFAYYVPSAVEAGEISATLTASFGDALALDSATVDGPSEDFWLGSCPEGIDSGEPVEFPVGGFCHHTFDPGYWTIVVEPAPRERLGLTTRDHVPGNWCMLGDGTRPKPNAPQTIEVFIPGLDADTVPLPEGMEWRGPGVCLLGGRGICTDDDCYFPIGNPAEYVLATPAGTVTATYRGNEQQPQS
jgi:hypothetical protein